MMCPTARLRQALKLTATITWVQIKTNSGNRFAKNEHDWQYWHDEVRPRLRKLYKEGYVLAVFSNQVRSRCLPRD